MSDKRYRLYGGKGQSKDCNLFTLKGAFDNTDEAKERARTLVSEGKITWWELKDDYYPRYYVYAYNKYYHEPSDLDDVGFS